MNRDSEELQAIKAIGTLLEAEIAQSEQHCRLSDKTIRLLQDTGVYATPIPTEYGGRELSPAQLFSLTEEIAYHDSAAAWCTMVYLTTATQAAFLPPEHAETVFRVKPNGHAPLVGGAVAPTGRGTHCNEGIKLNGHWAWGSGSHHCDWLVGGTLLTQGDSIEYRDNGEPKIYQLFVPQSDAVLQDNWNPSGLRGTGSVDFSIDAMVAKDRWTILGDTDPFIDKKLYRFPYFSLFAGMVSAVCIGIARRAVTDFSHLAQGKVPAFSSKTLQQSPHAQMEFGHAEALQLASHHTLFGAVTDAWQQTEAGQAPSVELRRGLRLAATQSALLAVQAVDTVYNSGGGSSVRGDCSLQRHFRDIHTATQHKLISTDNFRLAGGVRLSAKPAGSQL